MSAGARGRGAPPPSASRESARRPRPVSRSTMGQGVAPRAELAAAASPVPSPYQGLGGKGLPAHLELVAVAILADLLTGKVLDVEPSVFTWSMPEPPHLEHEAFMLIIPLSDKMVEDSLERLTSRRGERRDSPCGQGPGPGWVTLRRLRGPGGMVSVNGADPIVTFYGERAPIRLQDLVGSKDLCGGNPLTGVTRPPRHEPGTGRE